MLSWVARWWRGRFTWQIESVEDHPSGRQVVTARKGKAVRVSFK